MTGNISKDEAGDLKSLVERLVETEKSLQIAQWERDRSISNLESFYWKLVNEKPGWA